MRAPLLDSEAVTALVDPTHRGHRVVLARLAAVVTRRRKGAATQAIVPTAVRVGVGWDRSKHSASAINRLRISDAVLNAGAANLAADIVSRTGVSVDDAHVGAVAQRVDADDIVVLTSDPGGMIRGSAPRSVTAVRI